MSEQLPVLTPRGGYFAKQPVCQVWNDLDPMVPDELRDELSEAVKHRMQEGIVFEDTVEELLKAAVVGSTQCSRKQPAHAELAAHTAVGEVRWDAAGHLAAVFLVGDRSRDGKAAREDATMRAMQLGVPLLWNPRLPAIVTDLRISEPDFLVRHGDAPSVPVLDDEDEIHTHEWAYVPGDVKHHKALDGGAKPRAWRVADLDRLSVDHAYVTELTDPKGQPCEGTPRKEDAYQLAHYAFTLEALGHGQTGRRLGLLIGKEQVALVHDLDEPQFRKDIGDGPEKVSPMDAYAHDWAERIAVAQVAVTNSPANPVEPMVRMTKRTECAECVWSTWCDTQRKVTDDVSRVIGVTAEQADIHAEHGTLTVSDLARLDIATAMLVDVGIPALGMIEAARQFDPDAPASALLGSPGESDSATKTKTDRRVGLGERLATVGVTTAGDIADLCEVTAAYADTKVQRLVDQIDRARVLTVGKPHRARGAEFVDVARSSIELHTDIEDNGGFVYLIGVKAFGKGKPGNHQEKRRSEYEAFVTWETTPEAEAQVLADWWAYVEGMTAYAKINRWGVKGFCYTHHERSTLLKKADEHAGRPGVPTRDQLKAYFDGPSWVDLHHAAKSDVIFPTEDIKLKTIATKVCGFVWRDEDPSGGNSMAWYAIAVDPTVSEEEREAARQRLLAYNDDDCHATFAFGEWLSRNGEARRPGATLPGVETLDPVFRRLRRPVPPAVQLDQALAA